MKRKKRSRSLDHDVKSRSIRKSRQSTLFGDPNKGLFDKLMNIFDWYSDIIEQYKLEPDGVTAQAACNLLQAKFLSNEGMPIPIGCDQIGYNHYQGILCKDYNEFKKVIKENANFK